MTEETIEACPNCDSSRFYVRLNRNDRKEPYDGKKYRCRRCNQGFDVPIERAPHRAGSHEPSNGLAHRLSKMDPDEVGP